jgi:hypothetical protein
MRELNVSAHCSPSAERRAHARRHVGVRFTEHLEALHPAMLHHLLDVGSAS